MTTQLQQEHTGLILATTGEQIATVWQKIVQQGATPPLMVELHRLAQEVLDMEEEITARANDALATDDVEFKDATLTAIIELLQ